jgi:type IV secretion system protein TrbI
MALGGDTSRPDTAGRSSTDHDNESPPHWQRHVYGQRPQTTTVAVAPASPTVSAIARPVRTPSEERRLAAYQLQQQAVAAPTSRTGRLPTAAPGALGSQGVPAESGSLADLVRTMVARAQEQPAMAAGHAALVAEAMQNPRNDEEDEIVLATQVDREQFLERARRAAMEDMLPVAVVPVASRYEIKAGWDIPAVLEQSLNSDLPGEVKALVRENVYDTATGQHLLIPQGSRLVGVYDSRIAYGQDGMMVVWNRIIFPDGSSMRLEGMESQDARGQSGMRDKVDNHYRRLIGFAALTSAFSAAFQLSQSPRGGLLAFPSAGELAGTAVGRELSQFGAQVTRRNLNVQPTIRIPVGYRFNVRVNRDLVFSESNEVASHGR